MAITRRQFMKRTGLAAAGAMLGPGLLGSPWLRRASAATIGDRYLIVLFLDGGNDGLNTIIPAGGVLRPAYEAARGTGGGGLRVNDPLEASGFNDPNTGSPLGFHPGLAPLHQMYEAGQVAVIQGCGYPEYSLSHDESRSIWRTGAPLNTGGTGWVGRYMTAAGYTGSDIPAVCLQGDVAGELIQSSTSVLAFNRLRDFGFPYDFAYDDDDEPDYDSPFKDAAFNALYGAASGNAHPYMQYLGNTGLATLLATTAYPQCHTDYQAARGDTWGTRYFSNEDPPGLNSGTSRRFLEVAKVIYGVARGTLPNVKARHFQVSNGGYDTHSDQGASTGQHFDLHDEVAQSIKLFYDDLADMSSGAPSGSGLENLASKVLTVVYSEFSRRIFQNDNGTDHGSQGPVLVIGGGINGGVYGNHPNIDESALDDNGNSIYKQDNSNGSRSTDFRDVYGTIIKHWLNLDPSAILPTDPFAGPDYWSTRNFDMGFL